MNNRMEEIALVVLLINTELSDEASWHLYDEGLKRNIGTTFA